jgi:hypothetical protein
MDAVITSKRGETEAHRALKRLAAAWALEQGFPICATEVSLPHCRYRADLAAYKRLRGEPICCAIFECKQAGPDLRRDSGNSGVFRARLHTVQHRRALLEKHLRIHYPTLRTGESLFPEYDGHLWEQIDHTGYRRVVREVGILQRQLFHCLKFEKLTRYRCANLFFLVVPEPLFDPATLPLGWGVLAASESALRVVVRPAWHDSTHETQQRLLERIARASTRQNIRLLRQTLEAAR